MKIEIHGVKGYVGLKFSPRELYNKEIGDSLKILASKHELQKKSLEHSREMFRTFIMDRDKSKQVLIKSTEWDDSIDLSNLKHIMYKGSRYNVYDVTLNEDGVYVIHTNITVKSMERYNESLYNAVDAWMKWFYPNVNTFDEMKHMKDAPYGIVAEIDNHEKEQDDAKNSYKPKNSVNFTLEVEVEKEDDSKKVCRESGLYNKEQKESNEEKEMVFWIMFNSMTLTFFWFMLFKFLGWI